MSFTSCSNSMVKKEKMEKKKRQAKWAECKYCKARGLSIVYRSGKRKCLEKHMVLCKNDYLLENEVASRTESHALVRTVALLSQQVAELQAQVRVLMLKKDRYYIERDNFWNKLTPKHAWKRAKENTKRIITAYLNTYKPLKWYKNRWEWLSGYYVSKTIELHDVLSFGCGLCSLPAKTGRFCAELTVLTTSTCSNAYGGNPNCPTFAGSARPLWSWSFLLRFLSTKCTCAKSRANSSVF
jgi:hypothetical protein